MNPMDSFDSGLITLRDISAILREIDQLAVHLKLKYTWKIYRGRPMAEIRSTEKLIWQSTYKSKYFHFAYAYMIVGLRDKLSLIKLARDKEDARRMARMSAEEKLTYIEQREKTNFYGDLDYVQE